MTPRSCMAIGLAIVWALPAVAAAQNKPVGGTAPGEPVTVTAEYPTDETGILIHGAAWTSIGAESPTKTHLKHAFAPGLTYGAAPAAIVSDYQGLHAQVHVESGRPVICVCHFFAISGTPVLVRLHEKKTFRELDGGKLHIGAKLEEAEKNDLIATGVSKPEDTVWLVQPQQNLPPGEYAVMLGTQNVVIFPFTVDAGASDASSPAK